MRLILTIALSALMLSGCVANWPSNKTGPRWRDGGNVGSAMDSGGGSNVNAGQGSSPMGPGPLNY
jgi:hypothetical protein